MLTDVDKTIDRGNPLPNTHDVLPGKTVTARGTNSVNYVTSATNQAIIAGAKNGQFNIIQSGIFNWSGDNFNPGSTLGAFYSGTLTMGIVPHGLGFTPGVIAYQQPDTTSEQPLPYSNYFRTFGGDGVTIGSGGVWQTFKVTADSTNVYFSIDIMSIGGGTGFGGTWVTRYYLTQQTAS